MTTDPLKAIRSADINDVRLYSQASLQYIRESTGQQWNQDKLNNIARDMGVSEGYIRMVDPRTNEKRGTQ